MAIVQGVRGLGGWGRLVNKIGKSRSRDAMTMVDD